MQTYRESYSDMPLLISRHDFCENYFRYKAGQHVVFAGPTQRGKTTLAFDLLAEVVSPQLPAYVMVIKGRDDVVSKYAKQLNLKIVREWPVPPPLFNKNKYNGYVIWPPLGDIDQDEVRQQEIHYTLIKDRYANSARGKSAILVADETRYLSKVLKLDQPMVTVLSVGSSMNLGIWVFVQKPTNSGDTPLWAYGNAEHIFLFKDPEERNRQRFDEFGGISSGYVDDVVMQLEPYQALYIRRTGGVMCIVDKE